MSFLKADYRIVCEGAEYKEIERNARVAVLMYPVGIPLMYLLLLGPEPGSLLNPKLARQLLQPPVIVSEATPLLTLFAIFQSAR